MKFALRLIASLACLAFIASCSDDPVSSHGGGPVAASYQPTLLSMDGDYFSVCGNGNDLYAFGSAVLHHDGARWNPIEPPPIRGIPRHALGFPGGEIVVSDGSNTFVRKNGAWTDISNPSYFYMEDLWGSSPTDLYGVNYQGARHYDGLTWSEVPLPADLYAVTGRSADDVVISSYYGNLLRYDGTQWTDTVIDSFVTYRSLAMTESGRIFGSTYNDVYEVTGSTHHVILHGNIEVRMLCTAGDVLYAAGRLNNENNRFAVVRYDDDGWKNVVLDKGAVEGVWAGGGNVMVAGQENLLWRGTDSGGGFEQPVPQHGPLSCAAEIDGAVFLAGEGAYRYEDGTWTNLNKEYMTRAFPADIAGRSRNDIYAVGNEMILHFDGSEWTWVNAGFNQQLSSVCVAATGDVLVGGRTRDYPASMVAYRLHGGTWSPEEIPFDGHPIYDMCTTGDVVFAVGAYGMVAMLKNGVWHRLPTGISDGLYAVWAYDERTVYAANGDRNELCYYDGREWTPMAVDTEDRWGIRSVWGTRRDDLFAVGWEGSILHYDGSSWQPLPRVLWAGTGEVCGAGRDILAFGSYGVVSYHR